MTPNLMSNKIKDIAKSAGDVYGAVRRKLQDAYSAANRKTGQSYRWLRANPRWIYAALLIALGIGIAEQMEEHYAFLDVRYKAYQLTQDAAARLKGELYDHNTVLILIEDEEFWKGSYEGRRPVNQNSLAELIAALDEYKPKVIALDFDFSSPVPDGSILEHQTYVGETKNFLKTLRGLKSKPKIILPRTLGVEDGFYVTESAVYDKSDVGDSSFGYIDLPGDYRMIPPSLPLKNGSRLDSFAIAVVDAFDLTGKALVWDRQYRSSVYAAGYLYEEQFVRYSAREILCPSPPIHGELTEKVPGKIVIVGGAWSKDAYDRGRRIDERYTPVGWVPAVFLHANWVESMLGSRMAQPVRRLPRWTLELLLGFAGYYVFTRKIWLGWKAFYLLGVVLLWLGIAYVSSQNLGLFFDPFTPSLVSVGKAAFEQINHWRTTANLYAKQHVTPTSEFKEVTT